MPISDMPILTMLRTRMQWHQERQRVLAENVANAEPQTTAPTTSRRPISATRCGRHLSIFRAPTPATSPEMAAEDSHHRYEVRPCGNAVSHEDEMLKLAGNQMDYDAVSSLYTHSLALIKTAFGKS
jgi:flagellar basal-body rod protein FlgB